MVIFRFPFHYFFYTKLYIIINLYIYIYKICYIKYNDILIYLNYNNIVKNIIWKIKFYKII